MTASEIHRTAAWLGSQDPGLVPGTIASGKAPAHEVTVFRSVTSAGSAGGGGANRGVYSCCSASF